MIDESDSIKPGRVRRIKLLRQVIDEERNNENPYPKDLLSNTYNNEELRSITKLSKIGFDYSLVIEKFEANGRNEDRTRRALIDLL